MSKLQLQLRPNNVRKFGLFANDEQKIDQEGVTTILNRELGVDFIEKRDAAALSAFKTPEIFLQDRHAKISEIVKDTAAYAYKTYFDKLYELGLPTSKCEDFALKKAEEAYNSGIEILEIGQPGLYAKAMGIAEVQSAAQKSVGQLALDESEIRKIKRHRQNKGSKKV